MGKSHDEGGIPIVVADTSSQIEVEGDEPLIPKEALKKESVKVREGTNLEILDKINKEVGAKGMDEPANVVRSGDVVVCKRSAHDKKKKKYVGTNKEVVHEINVSGGCNPIINEKGEYREGGELNNQNNKSIEKTKYEIKSIISGKGEVRHGANIQAAISFLRRSKKTSSVNQVEKSVKKQEALELNKYIRENRLWIEESLINKYLSRGSEQRVYFVGDNKVIKLNSGYFYNSYLDYFYNLLLHNYFFPDTAYKLIGFYEEENELYCVVEQPFILKTGDVDLIIVKEFLLKNGFVNNRNEDYYNDELGIILEDLHDENVLNRNDILEFIDTVFYIKGDFYFEEYREGGAVEKTDAEIVASLEGEHKKSYKLAQVLGRIKRTNKDNIQKARAEILKAWKEDLQKHFQEEEEKYYNVNKDTESRKFKKEHKEFRRLINRIDETPFLADVLNFSRLLKKHIVSEERYFAKVNKLLFGGEVNGKHQYFNGKDGKKRFEIDDSEAKLLINISDILSKKIKSISLSNYLYHPQLFKAYLDFRRIIVEFKDQQAFLEQNNDIKEYFEESEFPNVVGEFEYNIDFPKAVNFYKLIYYINYEKCRNISKGKMYDLLSEIAIGELQHAIQCRENFSIDRGLPHFIRLLQKEYSDEIREYQKEIGTLTSSQLQRTHLDNELKSVFKTIYNDAYNKYESQLAEVESRLAMERISMNESERKQNPPVEIMNIRNIKYEGGGGIGHSVIKYRWRYTYKGEEKSFTSKFMTYAEAIDFINENGKTFEVASLYDKEKNKLVAIYSDGKLKELNVLKNGGAVEEAKKLIDSLTPEQIEDIKNKFIEIKNGVIAETQSKLDAFEAEKESLLIKHREEKDISKRSEYFFMAQRLNKTIRYYNNLLIAYRNGGDATSFTDKRGVEHKDIPDYSKIKTDYISFDEETILTDERPPYIPLIDEDVFRSKGYVFDAIRISENQYILATNGYNETRKQEYTQEEIAHGHPSDLEQGYVLTTLDQLVLINDYYYSVARAKNQKDADEKTQRSLDYYDRLPIERRQSYINQKGFYHSLPVAIKKKIAQADYEALSFEEKEKLYKPYQKYGAKRLVSKLEENTMWASFHAMYERFLNPEALPHTKDGAPIAINQNRFNIYGHKEVFEYWYWFSEMMKWKLNDIRVQRETDSEIRKIAEETSFGDSNTNNVLQSQYGILVKRQNGTAIQPNEIEQIKESWVSVQGIFGGISNLAKEDNLKVSHTADKYVYASKASGMYIPKMRTIAVTNKFGDEKFRCIMAHEIAHYIDNRVGEQKGERYSTDNYEGVSGEIASTFRKLMNEKTDSRYINATKECFARAMEQYYAIETFGEDVTYFDSSVTGGIKYIEAKTYVNKENYHSKIKPLIQKFLEQEKDFFKYLVEISEPKKEDGMKRIMKKEGDEDVVSLPPIKKIDIPQTEDVIELREKVYNFLIDNFKDKKIKNEQTGLDILFTKKGIKKLVFGGGTNKLNILYHIEDFVRYAMPLSIEEINKTNTHLKKQAKFLYLFESYVNINGEMQMFGFSTLFVENDNVSIYYAKYNVDEKI
jgi:hypothetical protein